MEELFVRRTLIGFTLKVIGLVVIGWGIIQAFIVLNSFSQPFPNEMGMIENVGGIGFGGFLTIVATNAVYGILIIGFGEVIDLLQKIHDKNEPKMTIESNLPVPTSSVPIGAQKEMNEFYTKMNMKIEWMLPTKSRDVFMVKVDGRSEYIDLGDHSPRQLSEEEAEKYL